MIRLVHMTDIHISSVRSTLARMWTSKRFLGGMNMLLFRRHQLRNAYLPHFVEHILTQPFDMATVTGDLSTTALHEEFSIARKILQPLIDRNLLITIPGNHDVYTRGAAKEGRYESFFGCCHSEHPSHPETPLKQAAIYPFIREVSEDVVVIGMNTCVPTGFFQAWGVVDAPQLERLATLLKTHENKTRVVLMHHFLENHHGEPGEPSRWIRNRGEVLDVFKQQGAELILHGHKHACYNYEIPGKAGQMIPVYNAGPTTWHHETPEMQGGYHIYEIDQKRLQKVLRFRFDPKTQTFTEHILFQAA